MHAFTHIWACTCVELAIVNEEFLINNKFVVEIINMSIFEKITNSGKIIPCTEIPFCMLVKYYLYFLKTMAMVLNMEFVRILRV